ncbi:MAG TPA: surface-adhesin E family protein [Novosphingobium sp.]|nr:surface-adhesin E family protein [Novosphingobium sp.]
MVRKLLELGAPLAVLAFMALPLKAQPVEATANWKVVAVDSEEGETEHIDTTSIERDGGIVTFWQKTEFSRDPQGWKTSYLKLEFDCPARKLRMMDLVVVYTDGTKSDEEGSIDKWFPIPADSLAAKIYPHVCPAK